MKAKCFMCALAAGMAMSAAAAAEPGQAGAPIQSVNLIGDVLPATKATPGHVKYNYATREWTVISMPGAPVAEGEVRGPVPNLIWSAIDPSGFYWNHRGSTLAANEIVDGGTLCGDPLTVSHTISEFTFLFQTNTLAVPQASDPDLGVSINLYWNFDPLCIAGPNGGVADEVDCIAADGVQYNILGMPGSIDGVAAAAWFVTIDLSMVVPAVVIPAGNFGWSYYNWVGYVSPTGMVLSAENQIAGPGMENGFNVYTTAPQVAPFIGNFWFGGNPFAQFNFELYSSDTTCAPSTSGACCDALDACTVAVDEAACIALGGTFTVAAPCSTFFCFPAPANDDCLNAEVITGFGQFAFDNRGATTAGPNPVPVCDVPVGEDVWFSWQAPCTGDVTVSTCLLNLTDDAFAVYASSSCGDLNTQVVCDDDGCGVIGGQATATFAASQGTNYLIRMGTWNSTVGGANFFDLTNVSCTGGPAFCDADWCQDGVVGVADIFCFLSDWFANDPTARNYGGSPGVPAIFAFLSEWFGEGTGPCP